MLREELAAEEERERMRMAREAMGVPETDSVTVPSAEWRSGTVVGTSELVHVVGLLTLEALRS